MVKVVYAENGDDAIVSEKEKAMPRAKSGTHERFGAEMRYL